MLDRLRLRKMVLEKHLAGNPELGLSIDRLVA